MSNGTIFKKAWRYASSCMIVFFILSSTVLAQENVFQIAGKKQLFIDDQMVATATDVKWQVNSPRKAGFA